MSTDSVNSQQPSYPPPPKGSYPPTLKGGKFAGHAISSGGDMYITYTMMSDGKVYASYEKIYSGESMGTRYDHTASMVSNEYAAVYPSGPPDKTSADNPTPVASDPGSGHQDREGTGDSQDQGSTTRPGQTVEPSSQ